MSLEMENLEDASMNCDKSDLIQDSNYKSRKIKKEKEENTLVLDEEENRRFGRLEIVEPGQDPNKYIVVQEQDESLTDDDHVIYNYEPGELIKQ